MTRILGDYMNGEVELRLNPIMQALMTESDKALEVRLREGLRCADRRDANGTHLGFWELMTVPAEFYDGMAAMRLLEERHGKDYVLDLVDYRRPKTAWEKVKYFFTGKLLAKK